MDDKSYNIRVPKRLVRVGMIVTVTALIVAPLTAIASHTFTDVSNSNTFHADIDWLAGAGITKGCNPPTNDEFCPNDSVSRGQMSAFMRRFAQYIDAEDGTPAQADLALSVASGVVGSDELEDNEPFNLVGASGQPAFQNGWVNFGSGWSQAGFFKDLQDVVHLKGTIQGGATGTTAFVLPPEYRPAQSLFLPVANGMFLYVLSNGAVQPWHAANGDDMGLDGLSFRVGVGGASAAPSQYPGQ